MYIVGICVEMYAKTRLHKPGKWHNIRTKINYIYIYTLHFLVVYIYTYLFISLVMDMNAHTYSYIYKHIYE